MSITRDQTAKNRIEIRTALDAAEAMYRSLQNMPDVCTRKYPYSGPIITQCARCAAMEKWEDVMLTSDMPGSRRKARESVLV